MRLDYITPAAAEAISLKQAGFEPVQLPPKSKAPNRKGWPKERLSIEEIPAKFANGENLGVLTGEPSHGLVDVDLDSAEAIAAASTFLPPTNRIHGRPSKERSHWWYNCNPSPSLEQWKNFDGSMIVELRGNGGQTVVPPSIHPDGEQIAYFTRGDPAKVSLDGSGAGLRLRGCHSHPDPALASKRWPPSRWAGCWRPAAWPGCG